jgi:hypothetical protein
LISPDFSGLGIEFIPKRDSEPPEIDPSGLLSCGVHGQKADAYLYESARQVEGSKRA